MEAAAAVDAEERAHGGLENDRTVFHSYHGHFDNRSFHIRLYGKYVASGFSRTFSAVRLKADTTSCSGLRRAQGTILKDTSSRAPGPPLTSIT